MKPYRLEWRPALNTNWTLIVELDEHPGELESYVRAEKRLVWTGYWRLVSQHVTEETGVVRQ